MKTEEELNALKEEVETVNRKLHELTYEELAQVIGGDGLPPILPYEGCTKTPPENYYTCSLRKKGYYYFNCEVCKWMADHTQTITCK